MSSIKLSIILLASLSLAVPAESQAPAAPALGYADLADLALPAPIVAHVQVTRAVALKGADAAGVAPGRTRFYIQAEIVSLIRGAAGLPAAISYLADVPNDARGRAPRIRRDTPYILLAAPVAGRPSELRLISPDAQLDFTPERADRMRAILREAARPDAPPPITGIGRAFHVRGSLPGESETQIFLQTADQRPVSLNILRRPGERPRWAVALTEIVDESAAEPPRDTLLWYRLACTLPPALPPQSLAEADNAERAAIQADYRLVRERLGPCSRTLARR